MESRTHTMNNLFAQLGEPCDESAIARFFETHGPLPGSMLLHEAGFWNSAQAGFLREAISEDADWAEVAENLNTQLHAIPVLPRLRKDPGH